MTKDEAPKSFDQILQDANKPIIVPEQLKKYVAAVVDGTYEITSVTIRPKREWVWLTRNEVSELAASYYEDRVVQVEEVIEMAEAALKDKNT